MTSSPLPQNYSPSEDEEFMNPTMVEYFRQKLVRWRAELLAESTETLNSLQEGGSRNRTSPTARRRKPTAPWNCAPATANAS